MNLLRSFESLVTQTDVVESIPNIPHLFSSLERHRNVCRKIIYYTTYSTLLPLNQTPNRHFHLREPPLHLRFPSLGSNLFNLIGNNHIDPTLQIHFRQRMCPLLTPMKRAMHKVNRQEQRNTNVRRKERTRTPFLGEENVETVDKSEESKGNHGNPRTVGLNDGAIRNRFPREILHFSGFTETDVDDGATDPGDESRSVGEINEPGEDD
jgi:hypothetical protein